MCEADTPEVLLRKQEPRAAGDSIVALGSCFRRSTASLRISTAGLLIFLVRGWQWGPSRALPPSCRYQPTCSAYAIEAITRYGPMKGGWLAARRLTTCHPWGGHGYDPVP